MNRVVAITATYRRPLEISRLIAALEQSTTPLQGLVVVDNANDRSTREHVERSTVSHQYENPGENLGCGGGLRHGEEVALRAYPDLTHVWILDDDTVPDPNTLSVLLEAMETHKAGAACPQAFDAEGNLNWFPGLRDRRRFDILRRSATPAAFIEQGGSQPGEFTWATGVALLVTRTALELGGLHRSEFWVRGEDLDFSLRVTAHSIGVYVPKAQIAHLPPGGGRVVDDFPERMKHAAMLQNTAYLFARTRHGRCLVKHWPGNAWRHLRRFGISSLPDVIIAFALGALAGHPAGAARGNYFCQKLAQQK